ncbi:LCP family protein [Lysinibacillus sp. FJAT-14222]|uniref:LCP family protein n=1 Tax=Lysinibacillus sp. FJAT-14222 TaxID=1932366 RepID=UPI001F51B646|nr:LCP family protein [Lysinibacillus sp. FJAT-14222]
MFCEECLINAEKHFLYKKFPNLIVIGNLKEQLSSYFMKKMILLQEFKHKRGFYMQRKSSRSKRTKPKNKILKISLLVISMLLLTVTSYGAYAFVKFKNAYDSSKVDLDREGNKSDLREEDVSFTKDPISILLLGVEDYSSKAENGRADTQMVITLDPDTSEINLITVPRDARVNIENAGEYTGIHKINAAYNYGSITGYGAIKLQLETVEKFLNIPIDNFIAVNFDGFRDIVDALGGVIIDVKEDFWEDNIYDKKRIEFHKGEAHLNGEEALAFVRMRYRPVNATYSREERQRQFLTATINQAKSTNTIFKIGQIADILGKNVETDLNPKEIYALQKQYLNSKNLSVKTLDIQGEDQYINNVSYYIPDMESLEKVSMKLRNILELKEENFKTNADIAR